VILKNPPSYVVYVHGVYSMPRLRVVCCQQVNLNPNILAVRLDVLHLLNYNVISDSNEDTTTILSDPVSAKWCITLVWAEHFVIKVFGF